MRRLFEFTGIIMAIALVMVVIYHLVNTVPPGGASKESQAIAIFEEASCITCHQKTSDLPFYSDIPIVGHFVKNDQQKGYRMFDMEDAWSRIKKGEAINEAHLAKIEMETIVLGTMPPMRHSLLHWGSSVTTAKKSILENWIRYHRATFYPSELSAEQFKYEPVRPIPASLSVNNRKAKLGEKLFYDKRLSSDNSISCASCHNLNNGGANNRQYQESINKHLCSINTPTIYNAHFNTIQSWSGSATSIEEYIEKHLLSPDILGNSSFAKIIEKLQKDNDINDLFEKLYDDGITMSSITNAIAEFGKTLLTPDCDFDKYIKGDEFAINKMQVFGYEQFKSYKCATCHAGINFGGQTRELMGRHKDYFEDRGWELTKDDMGYFNHTADEYDRYRFKVPGLRNVELTKPYFHDGSQQALYDAVITMGSHQSGRKISNEDAKAIVAFLETLTGKFENKLYQ